MHHSHRAVAPSCAGTGRRRGFSVVELLVAVAIVAILAGLAAPAFQSMFLSTRLTSYANDFVATSMLARSTAISQNAPVTLCQSSDGATCGGTAGWETGYVLLCRSNDGLVCTNTPNDPDAAPTLLLGTQPPTASGWKISAAGGVSEIVFQSTGTGATTASLTICRASPVGSNERVVRVSPTGRATVTKTSTATCS